MKRFGVRILTVSYMVFSGVPLYAAANILENTAVKKHQIPNVPSFDLSHKGEALRCYPSSLVETNSKKKLVEFVCVQRNLAEKLVSDADDISSEEDRGRQETKRFQQLLKDKKEIGAIYHVKIPAGDARYPGIAAYEAKQMLQNNHYFGKYIRWLLPAKFYISLRPQYAEMAGSKEGKHFHNAGSRAGFFYAYKFNSGINITMQYEGNINKENKGNFINLSEQSDSNRRLSYLAAEYKGITLLGGKYWSAYYDIAGITDYFMAYGAQASGVYNNSGDGSVSGTGRADKVLQVHFAIDDFESTLQYQYGHASPEGIDGEFGYRMGASLVYKGWKKDGWKAGAAFAYGKYDEITAMMRQMGITGNDQAYIAGLSFKKNRFIVNGNLSYTRNHMNDDQGVYFDGVGVEIYARYDVTSQIRTVAGINWLKPTGGYRGQYEIKKGILSFQYTFGKRTFDDVVYVEIALPHGSSASGVRGNTSVAIGLRYLIDL